MDYRSLGRTGMQVSPLCLGAMMFGAWGEPDHDTSIKIIHRALDAGINFIDTADVYSQGESETIVGKALANGRRDDVILATKFHGQMGVAAGQPAIRTNAVTRGAGSSRKWRTACAVSTRTGSTSTRCTGPTGTPRRGDAFGADRPAAPGQDPRVRFLDLPRRTRSSRRSGSRGTAGSARSSPSSRRTRSWSAESRRTCCR